MNRLTYVNLLWIALLVSLFLLLFCAVVFFDMGFKAGKEVVRQGELTEFINSRVSTSSLNMLENGSVKWDKNKICVGEERVREIIKEMK